MRIRNRRRPRQCICVRDCAYVVQRKPCVSRILGLSRHDISQDAASVTGAIDGLCSCALRPVRRPRYYLVMREHRLTSFFVLTFVISWGIPGLFLLASRLGMVPISLDRYSPLSFLFFWAPALSAVIVIGVTQGRAGVAAFLRHAFTGRFKWRWWTAVIVGVPLLKLLAYLLAGESLPFDLFSVSFAANALFYAGLLTLLEIPIGEFGWRGFALPLLQRRVNGLAAALFLGVIWAIWYMPWLLPGTVMNWSLGGDSIPAIVRFFASAMALSVILTVIFNGSSGSILLMVLYRWLDSPPQPWQLGTHISYVDAVITVTAAVILVFAVRRRYLSRTNRYTKVTPGAAQPFQRRPVQVKTAA